MVVNSRHTLPDTIKQNIVKFARSCMNMLGEPDRFLEFAYVGDEAIGFYYCKIDHENHKGFIKPGYGYIMEFYIKPECRCKGYGRIMFERIRLNLSKHGVKRMWLTAGSFSIPFWKSMGFKPTAEICPDNDMVVFIKFVGNSLTH